jgi:enamine deaminase RidA (YjgF/YER057c/UK114 family)
MVPASTGIGVANHAGTAVVADVYAVKPKTDKISIFAVPSPLQCPALDYRSSFSRAVEVDTVDQRLLMISGTASIAPGGETVLMGDTAGQIKRTMEVVDAILKSRDMDWVDTTRAIAYFTSVEDVYLLDEYCDEHGLPDMPVAVAHAEICRPDLLFELELDACVAK